MGNSKYLDGLSQDERNALVKQLWNIQNHKCFICGEEIDLDIQTTNIDHIKPLANGGKDEPVNFAITADTSLLSSTISMPFTSHAPPLYNLTITILLHYYWCILLVNYPSSICNGLLRS